MMGRRERTLEAYRDGGLSDRQRARVLRWLERDAESREHVERTEALGRVVREAWGEGPPAPPPDRIMAAIRPAMRRVDAERRQQSWWTRARRSVSPVLTERPAWEWASATGLAAAAVVAVVLVEPPSGDVPREAQHLVAIPSVPPIFAAEGGGPTSVYGLARGDMPLRVYEKEGATVIYVGEEPEPAEDDVSFGLQMADWA